jgi:hypothetical protein
MKTMCRSIVSLRLSLVILVLAGLLASACAMPAEAPDRAAGATQAVPPASTTAPTAQPPATSAPAFSEEALKNGQYRLPDVGEFRLQDGTFEYQYGEGATQRYQVGYSGSATGDLNGDGRTDAVVTLSLNRGGSGTFIYVAAVADTTAGPRQAAVELLGDRVQVQSLAIRDGQITMDVKAFAPGDPMCCPSQLVSRSYRLDGTLRVVAEVRLTPSAPQIAPTAVSDTQSAPSLDAKLAGVRFNPSAMRCDGEPARTMTDQIWQANAVEEGGYGTKPAKPGQKLTIQLRNKLGSADAQYQVRVSVIAPGGSVASAAASLKGNDLQRLDYPQAFDGAKTTTPGTYTVLWQVNGGFVTCWGFEVK